MNVTSIRTSLWNPIVASAALALVAGCSSAPRTSDELRVDEQGSALSSSSSTLNGCTIIVCEPGVPRCDVRDRPDGVSCNSGGRAGVCEDGECTFSEPGPVGSCDLCSSSSYEGVPWALANVTDGQKVSLGSAFGWSSQVAENDPSKWVQHPEWVVLHLATRQTFSKVTLYPRNDAGWVGEGFPLDFKIQVWNGYQWLDRLVVTDYPKPAGVAQTFQWGFEDTTDYVRVYATRLRPTGNDGYLMQLAEFEVQP